jgi:hypothetical protein
MNSKHRRTLTAVFADPVSPTIKWRAIESMLIALGCRVIEGKGSHVRATRDGVVGTFYRPHPGDETKPYQVRLVREFLIKIGEAP